MFNFNFDYAAKEGIRIIVRPEGHLFDPECGGTGVIVSFACQCCGYSFDGSPHGDAIHIDGSFRRTYVCDKHKDLF